MGWWWPFGKGSAEAKPLPKERLQQLDEDAKQLAPLRQAAGAQGKELLAPLPRPTSIFEFGKPVAISADHLVGMCAGENPDAIQACTWTIEPLQGKAREKRPVYRIEF